MQVMTISAEQTMSSTEIATLVEKRPDNVKRTIETLVSKGVIQLPQIEEVKNHRGQFVSEYRIGKRDSYVIVAQLSPEFTARLVDRWQELEDQAKPEWMRHISPECHALLNDMSKQISAEKAETARLQHLMNVTTDHLKAGMTAPEFAKTLNGVNAQKINAYLAEHNLLQYEGGYKGYGPTAYARDKYFRVAGYGDTPFKRAELTTLGAKWIYSHYLKGRLPMKANWNGEYSHDII